MHTVPSVKSTSTFKPRVRRLGPGRYLVESQTKPRTGHPVTTDHCNCPGFAYRGTCRHVVLVRSLEPAMERWYGQTNAPATRPTVEEEHAAGASMVANTTVDAHLAEAWRVLTIKRRALADAHPQSDERATLLREVDQAERAVAALEYSAMRAA